MSVQALIKLEREQYEPGDLLVGAFVLEGTEGVDLTSLEASVLWQTEGKGDQDLGVVLFVTWPAEELAAFDPDHPRTFELALPAAPLSYDGELVRVRWLARVRVRYRRGDLLEEIVGDAGFRLGRVRPPREWAGEEK